MDQEGKEANRNVCTLRQIERLPCLCYFTFNVQHMYNTHFLLRQNRSVSFAHYPPKHRITESFENSLQFPPGPELFTKAKNLLKKWQHVVPVVPPQTPRVVLTSLQPFNTYLNSSQQLQYDVLLVAYSRYKTQVDLGCFIILWIFLLIHLVFIVGVARKIMPTQVLGLLFPLAI